MSSSSKKPSKPQVPFMVNNPRLDINEDRSEYDPRNDRFLEQFKESLSKNELTKSYNQGLTYLKEKYKDYAELGEMELDYLDTTILTLYDENHPIPKDAPVNKNGDKVDTTFPLFLSVMVHKDNIGLFFDTLEDVLKTNLKKDGFKLKFIPKIFSPNDIQDIQLETLHALDLGLMSSKTNGDKAFIDFQGSRCEPHEGEMLCGMMIGQIQLSHPNAIKYSDDDDFYLTDLCENIENQLDDLGEVFVTTTENYVEAAEYALSYDITHRVTNYASDHQIIHFDSIETEIGEDYCQFTLNHDGEQGVIKVPYPKLLLPALENSIDDLVQEFLHMEDVAFEIDDEEIANVARTLMGREPDFDDFDDFDNREDIKNHVQEQLDKLKKNGFKPH